LEWVVTCLSCVTHLCWKQHERNGMEKYTRSKTTTTSPWLERKSLHEHLQFSLLNLASWRQYSFSHHSFVVIRPESPAYGKFHLQTGGVHHIFYFIDFLTSESLWLVWWSHLLLGGFIYVYNCTFCQIYLFFVVCFCFSSSGSIVSDYKLYDRCSIPGSGKGLFLYSLRPDQLWGPPSRLSNWYWGFFPQR
jgi:hypothetical protein